LLLLNLVIRSACAHLQMELPFLRRITSLYLSEFTDLPMASRSANQRNNYMIRFPWCMEISPACTIVRRTCTRVLKSDIDRY
jgi:hypothetical protein